MIDADRDLFVVEMKAISLRDWDPFRVSHFKGSSDKLESEGGGDSGTAFQVRKMKRGQVFGPK